jgi:hypothetical protein
MAAARQPTKPTARRVANRKPAAKASYHVTLVHRGADVDCFVYEAEDGVTCLHIGDLYIQIRRTEEPIRDYVARWVQERPAGYLNRAEMQLTSQPQEPWVYEMNSWMVADAARTIQHLAGSW